MDTDGLLGFFISDLRNKTLKQIKQGRLAVAAFLSELPRTQHDLKSFVVDVSLVQVPLSFTVVVLK